MLEAVCKRIQDIEVLGSDDGHVVIGLTHSDKIDEADVFGFARKLEGQRRRTCQRSSFSVA